MEGISFDLSGILTEEEAKEIFENQERQAPEEPAEPEEETQEKEPAEEEEPDEGQPSEKVGEEDETEENAINQKGDGSSPLASIANALKEDGIFPDFTDEEINAIKTPEDFANMFEKVIQARFDERQKRIDEALGYGVQPDTVRMYEQTLQYLGSINEEALSSEGEEGENLRKKLIYNDLINRGYSQEKAQKEVEKSFKSGSDIEDAKDALEALNNYYKKGYAQIREDAKKQAEAAKEAERKQSEDFRKMVLEDDVMLGETKLDKRTKQRVFDAVSKPVYKDPDTGRLLTEVQKFQKEHPLEFLKQLGMWFVLTDGGKNTDGFTKQQLREEKNKGIRELERKINSTSLNSSGSLRYSSGEKAEGDPLLSDGWKIGWN